MKIRKRLIQKHSKDCWALKRPDPWCLLGDNFRGRGGRYTGDTVGRKKGYHTWLIALCLDPNCNAEIALNEDDLLAIALGKKGNPNEH